MAVRIITIEDLLKQELWNKNFFRCLSGEWIRSREETKRRMQDAGCSGSNFPRR